jgi:hypothetical protein
MHWKQTDGYGMRRENTIVDTPHHPDPHALHGLGADPKLFCLCNLTKLPKIAIHPNIEVR